MIPVTKPYLPASSTYITYLNAIWEREWLTNNGPLVQNFESRLRHKLGCEKLLFTGNGTIALQIAIKALDLCGEIITTPFSYVATTSSIVWEGCIPVFVDIDPYSFNIDPAKIEEAITPATSAILATHCFGNACDIDAIERIAERHDLKVIYDAAHAFGTTYKGKSIFAYGDISTLRLHATKLLHSVEGGVVFAADEVVFQRASYMRNFGHDGPEKFKGVGINGKNSEFHAAMGLCVLNDIELILERRKEQCNYYDELLEGVEVQCIGVNESCGFNYAYYPVVFKSEGTALKVKNVMERNDIFPRRYFYPGLNHLHYVKPGFTPRADKISQSILCLPLYHTLLPEEQNQVVDVIKATLGNE